MVGGLVHQDYGWMMNIQPSQKHLCLFAAAKGTHHHVGSYIVNIPMGKSVRDAFLYIPFIIEQCKIFLSSAAI